MYRNQPVKRNRKCSERNKKPNGGGGELQRIVRFADWSDDCSGRVNLQNMYVSYYYNAKDQSR